MCRNGPNSRRCRIALLSYFHRLAFVAAITLLLSIPSHSFQDIGPAYLSSPLYSQKRSCIALTPSPASLESDLEQGVSESADTTEVGLPTTSRLRSLTGRIRSLPRKFFPTRNSSAIDEPKTTVRNIGELRREVLQNRVPLKDIGFNLTAHPVNATTVTTEQLSNHDVIKIISQRVKTNSTPGSRAPGDRAHVALAIEGGGMRGAVSAGMAAAIASLGLSDAFDSVYGSSA